jgi:hypothetical protein
MKTFILFILILTLNTNLSKSQNITDPSEIPNYRKGIVTILGKHMNLDKLNETPSEHVYIFSITLSFNAAGKVDTVYFSDNMTENLKQIVNADQDMTKAANLIDFKKEFANKLVILPVILKRAGDWRINNQDEFIKGITTIWPKLKSKDKLKPAVFLDPYVNYYAQILN